MDELVRVAPTNDPKTGRLRDSYDRLARPYADNLFDELSHKPLDRWIENGRVNRVVSDDDWCAPARPGIGRFGKKYPRRAIRI